MDGKMTSVIPVIILLFIGTMADPVWSRAQNRGRATDLDIFSVKPGDCPSTDMTASRGNVSCAKGCYLDMECPGEEKCCQNDCGGTSCLPTTQLEPEAAEPEGSPPVMLIGSSVYTVDEGDDLTVFCNASSPVEVSYAWIVTQPGVSMAILLPGTYLDNVRVSFDGRSLSILSAALDDVGNYGCLASNSYGFSTMNHKLKLNARNEVPTPTDGGPTTETIDEPLNRFTDIIPPSNELCAQNMDRGHCHRHEVMWYYNLQAQRCEPFTYGGCGGNANRFRTYAECGLTCTHRPVDPCRHPIETGRCKANFQRWAFQEATGECVRFTYGGCGANGNNFRTREECGNACLDRETRKDECECTRPKMRSSYCRSDFVISGRVRQEIPSAANGPLLIIETDRFYRIPDNFPYRLGDLAGNITMIRDLSRTTRGCHCIAFTVGDRYIFMGNMNEVDEAVIYDSSYVQPSNAKRRTKIAEINRCPGDNRVPDADMSPNKEGARPELSAGLLEERIHVEREVPSSAASARVPNYQRKPNRRSRIGRLDKRNSKRS